MAYPELARLQAVRFMHAEVDINYSSVQAISSEVKLEQGGFGISGSMAAATSGESGETQTLYATTKHPKVATKVEPQVAMSANYKTEYSREHHVTDFFDANTKHKHRFCLSGDGQYLSGSGRLFVGLRDGNGDGSCGGTGRDSRDPRGPTCR
jgi:hypothetical protein